MEEISNPERLANGSIDFSFLIIFLLPILLIILTYNISGLEILENKIKIYPNPTNGIINIKALNDINNITLLNYLGNQLLRVENKNNNQDIKRIDLSNFVKGIYFIQIEHNNQLSIFKITLQ